MADDAPLSWQEVEDSPQFRALPSKAQELQIFKNWIAQSQSSLDNTPPTVSALSQKAEAQRQFIVEINAIGSRQFGVKVISDQYGKPTTLLEEASFKGVDVKTLFQTHYDRPELPYLVQLEPHSSLLVPLAGAIGELFAYSLPIFIGIVIYKRFPKLGAIGATVAAVLSVGALSAVILCLVGKFIVK